jgi:hypothetical protein
MSDEQYFRAVSESPEDQGPLKASEHFRLEEFEVVEVEAF